MQNKLLISTITIALIATLGGLNGNSFADEDTIAELKRQVELLQDRVEELEEQNQKRSRMDVEEDSWQDYHRQQQRWDPFAEMDRMQAEMNRMFENSFTQRGPSSRGGMFSSSMGFDYDIDLKETDDGYEIIFDMQGLDEEEVDIQINSHSITIKGEHSRKDSQQGPNQNFQSRSFGSFMQTIPLPVDADTAKIKTEKKGDSLVIKMPRKST